MRFHRLVGRLAYSSAIPVAYFEMRAGRCPASHSARSAGEGVAGFFVESYPAYPSYQVVGVSAS